MLKIDHVRRRCAELTASLRDLGDCLEAAEGRELIEALLVEARDHERILAARGRSCPPWASFDGTEKLSMSVMSPNPPWMREQPRALNVPGMITKEERQYYVYLSRFFTGEGAVVELGPWLGASTNCIVDGLRANPRFVGEKVHVFDDFVWRSSWMDGYVSSEDRLPNHADFRHLFDRHTSRIASSIEVHRNKISDCDGNENLPPVRWEGGQIEMMFIDCGRNYEANQAWYVAFSSAFVPGRTLLVMQDWRLHRELPFKWYNQTLNFTEAKGETLLLIHELSDGGVGTFLFRG